MCKEFEVFTNGVQLGVFSGKDGVRLGGTILTDPNTLKQGINAVASVLDKAEANGRLDQPFSIIQELTAIGFDLCEHRTGMYLFTYTGISNESMLIQEIDNDLVVIIPFEEDNDHWNVDSAIADKAENGWTLKSRDGESAIMSRPVNDLSKEAEADLEDLLSDIEVNLS